MKTDLEVLKDWWSFMTPKRWLLSILVGIGMVANLYLWTYIFLFFDIIF